jgi:predicted HNH restriction endonuclease
MSKKATVAKSILTETDKKAFEAFKAADGTQKQSATSFLKAHPKNYKDALGELKAFVQDDGKWKSDDDQKVYRKFQSAVITLANYRAKKAKNKASTDSGEGPEAPEGKQNPPAKAKEKRNYCAALVYIKKDRAEQFQAEFEALCASHCLKLEIELNTHE